MSQPAAYLRLAMASYGMTSAEGEAALSTLLERLDLAFEPEVDLLEFGRELDEGLALVAAFYPEVHSRPVQAQITRFLDDLFAGCGIGLA